MLAAIAYTILFALFIGLCALADFLEARDDPFSDGPYGDLLALPDDFEIRNHGERK